MIYLELFLTFLQVGAFSFGGGYGMIAMIRELVLAHGWLGESELIDLIAVAESTPGPIAVNMATFVGSTQGGFLGSVCATAGVVLPSFIVILIIAALISRLLKFSGVKAFLGGVRPCVIGLILATAATMFCRVVLGSSNMDGEMNFDIRAAFIFAIIVLISISTKKILKKKISPIFMIVISAALGIVAYGFI